MVAHNVTETVEKFLSLGGSEEEVVAAGRVDNWGGGWRALNRAAEYRLKEMLALRELNAARAVPPADRPATPAQRKFIADLGGNAPDDLSRPEASSVIFSLKARRAGARMDISGEIWD